MTQPGLHTSPTPTGRSGVAKKLIAASIVGGAFFLAVRSCVPEPEKPVTPEPKPEPRVIMLWEMANTIAVNFDTRGKVYAGLGANFMQAQRIADEACFTGLPRGEHCYGIKARESETAGKACIGIGIDWLRNPDARPPVSGPVTSYVIVEALTPQDVRPKLQAACTARDGQCALARDIFCNYGP